MSWSPIGIPRVTPTSTCKSSAVMTRSRPQLFKDLACLCGPFSADRASVPPTRRARLVRPQTKARLGSDDDAEMGVLSEEVAESAGDLGSQAAVAKTGWRHADQDPHLGVVVGAETGF